MTKLSTSVFLAAFVASAAFGGVARAQDSPAASITKIENPQIPDRQGFDSNRSGATPDTPSFWIEWG